MLPLVVKWGFDQLMYDLFHVKLYLDLNFPAQASNQTVIVLEGKIIYKIEINIFPKKYNLFCIPFTRENSKGDLTSDGICLNFEVNIKF